MKAITRADAPIVTIHNDNLWTTSLIVAREFGKKHKNVLQSIEKKGGSERFNRLNFQPVEYLDAKGESRKMYNMTRDGFMKLVFGFTGEKADLIQEAFIEEFNRMEAQLRRIKSQQLTFDWQESRLSGKMVRRELTDVLKEFVDYAKAQGSKSPNLYYMNFTKMQDAALFTFETDKKGFYEPFRDVLTARQLQALSQVENLTENAIREGMANDMFYKDIYKLAKERVETFSQWSGKTVPGSDVKALPASNARALVAA